MLDTEVLGLLTKQARCWDTYLPKRTASFHQSIWSVLFGRRTSTAIPGTSQPEGKKKRKNLNLLGVSPSGWKSRQRFPARSWASKQIVPGQPNVVLVFSSPLSQLSGNTCGCKAETTTSAYGSPVQSIHENERFSSAGCPALWIIWAKPLAFKQYMAQVCSIFRATRHHTKHRKLATIMRQLQSDLSASLPKSTVVAIRYKIYFVVC